MKGHVNAKRGSTSVLALMSGLALVALALLPAAARAQTPIGTIVVYEVAEALTLKPKGATSPEEFQRRLAEVAILGKQVVDAAPNTIFAGGPYFLYATGQSSVNLMTGLGPLRAELDLLTDVDPERASLDTLVITHSLQLRGTLDLTTAMQGFATMNGRWKSRGTRQAGTFQGTFFIPFQLDGLPGYWYLDSKNFPGQMPCATPVPGITGLCPVGADEFLLGIPLTKAIVSFYAGSRDNSGRRDNDDD